ncbi:MAG: hypothetical protein KA715_14200 [Xanthomonadaceae bacterium]|nr:hypothetical protein [Xanthomonadaceae bacterium]
MSATFFLILITFSTLADPAPAPSGAPPDIQKICAKARSEDEANKNNPQYQRSEVNEKCAQIYASKLSSRTSKVLGNMKTPIIAMCGVASGICIAGKADTKIKAIGERLAGVCGTMGGVSSIAESVATHQLEEKISGERSVYDLKSSAEGAVGIAGDGKHMRANFAEGQNNSGVQLNDKGEEIPRNAKQEKRQACGTIAKEVLMQGAEMANHYQTMNKMEEMENKQKLELLNLITQNGGDFNTENYQSEHDADADLPHMEEPSLNLPEFPPELAGPFEELSGMRMDDVLANGGNPNDMMGAMMNGLGLPSSDLAAALAAASNLPATPGTGDADTKSSALSASNETYSIPSMEDLLKGLLPNREPADQKGSTLKAKDISKMTASEFEKDTKHNIFARVSLRYNKKDTHLERLPWVGKFNIGANPKPIDALTTRFPASKMN